MNNVRKGLRRMRNLSEVRAYLNEVKSSVKVSDQLVFEVPEEIVSEVVKAVISVELSVIDIYEGSKGYLVFVIEKRF